MTLSISVRFHKNSLIVVCIALGRFEIKTEMKFKLLDHNWNHQQGFVKQKIVALHHCGFNLKLPKHCYCQRYFGQTLSVI